MRKSTTIILIVILLLQMSTGLLMNSQESDNTFITSSGNYYDQECGGGASNEEIRDKHTDARVPESSSTSSGTTPEDTVKPDGVCGATRAYSRASISQDQDEFGGSWFDDFEDDSGVEWKNNLSLENGVMNLAIVPKSPKEWNWVEAQPDDTPHVRSNHAMCYDGTNKLSVMFGGYYEDGGAGYYLNDTWIYNSFANTWTQTNPNPHPTARSEFAMVYDSKNHKVVLFGGLIGTAGSGSCSYETWVYDVSANIWTNKTAAIKPPKRFDHAMAYDSRNNKVVMFGGSYYNPGREKRNDTWVYDITNNIWTEKHPLLSPPAGPSTMTYDSFVDRIVMIVSNDDKTWLYDTINNTWIGKTTSPFPSMDFNPVIYDEFSNRVLFLDTDSQLIWSYDTLKNIWENEVLSLSLPLRRYPSAIFDSENQMIVLFGGMWSLKWLNDTWKLKTTQFAFSTTVTSIPITLPDNMTWETLSLIKKENTNTYINVSIINAETNDTIITFTNLTKRNINLTSLKDLSITSIRLKAYFSGNGGVTPLLDSWGVEWTAENAWRDSFTGDERVANPILADNYTVGLWHLDDKEAKTVFDSSGKGNHGSFYGEGEFSEGRFGAGLLFGGNDDYVDCGNDASLSPSTEITVEAWVKADTVSENHEIVSKFDHIFYIQKQYRLWISHGKLKWQVGDKSIETPIVGGTWNHITATFCNGKMNLYLDGELKSFNTSSEATIRAGDRKLLIGTYKWNDYYYTGEYFDGIIDEVRISNIRRSAEEVYFSYRIGFDIRHGQVQLMENEVPLRGCMRYWKFDEGSGDTAYDSSGNGYDGKINVGNGDNTDFKWTSGIMGKAMQFDGKNDHINCRELIPNPQGTVAFWVNVDRVTGDKDRIMGGNDGFEVKALASGAGYKITNDLWISGVNVLWSESVLNFNQWYHIGCTYNSTGFKEIYIDGKLDISAYKPHHEPQINNFYIGVRTGSVDYFDGMIDEVVIYDRVLSSFEIRRHSSVHIQNGTFRSKIINLPSKKIWNAFHFNSSVPKHSCLNISIHDANTNYTLHEIDGHENEHSLDLSEIDPGVHPSIYLKACFQSNQNMTPALDHWGVNWGHEVDEIIQPELITDLPRQLNVTEDKPLSNVTDLADYFYDIYFSITPPTYALEFVTDTDNITLNLNGSKLDVTYLADNWTGYTSVIANCTNMHGLSTLTNMFNITIIPIDDAPVWKSTPPPISIKEGNSSTTEYSLDRYVFDAENDILEFYIYSEENEKVIVDLDAENCINISTSSFSGHTSITATVRQVINKTLYSDISIPVNVSKNIPPEVVLEYPLNDSKIASTSVTLEWKVRDPDTDSKDIRHDLYFGNTTPPPLFKSNLKNKNYRMTGLKNGTSYYWYVIPCDEMDEGMANNIFAFSIDITTLVPEVFYPDPADGSTVNTTSIQLSWKRKNFFEEKLHFDIYFGIYPDNLAFINRSENKFYIIENLSDNTSYYWNVIPWTADVSGKEKAVIWNFFVDLESILFHNISWKMEDEPLNVKEGNNKITLDFTITNTGNDVNNIDLYEIDDPEDIVYIDVRPFSLQQGESKSVPITILTYGLDKGKYKIDLEIKHRGGQETIEILFNITGKEQSKASMSSPDNNLPRNLGIIFIAVIFIIIFIIIKKRREKEEEEDFDGIPPVSSDTIEADILHVPTPGERKVSSIPYIDAGTPSIENTFDSRYQFKGRKEAFTPNKVTGSTVSGKAYNGDEIPESAIDFDFSALHIPSEFGFTPDDVKRELLALPPARYLEVREERRLIPIDEVFLLTPSGLLVQHYSMQRETGLNEDILAGMLSAVKSFIADSLSMLDKVNGEKGEVNRIDFGKYSVMMATGKTLALVAISAHKDKDVILDQIRNGLEVLDEEFGEIMIDWSGDMSKVEGVKPYIESIVKGEFNRRISSFEIESAGKESISPSSGETDEKKIPKTVSDEKESLLLSDIKTVDVALPDGVNVSETESALPEKIEVSSQKILEKSRGKDILAALDNILEEVDRQTDPVAVSPAEDPEKNLSKTLGIYPNSSLSGSDLNGEGPTQPEDETIAKEKVPP